MKSEDEPVRVVIYGANDRVLADRYFTDAEALAEAEAQSVFSERVRQEIGK